MSEPRWVSKQALLLLHGDSLAEHGGLEGLRDEGLLDSALARPLNLHAHEDVTDIPRLAACYAAGVARNHPFVDGNKRAGFMAMGLFLKLNGLDLRADKVDATRAMMALAAGEIDETAFAAWIRAHAAPR